MSAEVESEDYEDDACGLSDLFPSASLPPPSSVESNPRAAPRPMGSARFRFGAAAVCIPPAREVNMAQCVWKGSLLTAAFIASQIAGCVW